MSDISEQIKMNVRIKSLLDRLGIKYNNKNWIWEDGKFRGSYNFIDSGVDNYITNHNPGKNYRPQGNPLEFYIRYKGCEAKEAFEFFEKEFNIKDTTQLNQVPVKKPIIQMPILNDEEKIASYLRQRSISYSRLPRGLVQLTQARVFGSNAPQGISECIQCPMYEIVQKKFQETGYQLRSIQGKGFFTNGSDGIFMHFTPNIKKDYIFLVEGLSDFLSIRQYDEHVIGFKSSKTPPSAELISFLSKFKKIYLLFDNDDAGITAKEKFKDMIDSNIYEISESEDINELAQQLDEDLTTMIKSSSYLTKEKDFQHLSYFDGLSKGLEELFSRNRSNVMSWGFEQFDRHLGFLLEGQLTVVGGETGMGKSTFVNTIANNVSNQGFKVARFSLEDRPEENRINELYYRVCYIRSKREQNNNIPEHHLFEANMCDEVEYPNINNDIKQAESDLINFNKGIIDLYHKKMLGIEELEQLFKDVVLNEGVKLVIIDHLHYIKFGKEQRHDLAIESFMHELNNLLRKYAINCILVSHYRKLNKNKDGQQDDPDNDSFKDGSSIAQVANNVIHIARDKSETDEGIQEDGGGKTIRYLITKNRGKSWTGVIKGRFFGGRIIMGKSKLSEQRREERKKNIALNQRTL